MTHVACDSKLRPFAWLSMHPCPENVVAIGCVVVYFTWAAHAFSAGIKCRHCIQNTYCLKGLSMRSTLGINEVPSQQGVRRKRFFPI